MVTLHILLVPLQTKTQVGYENFWRAARTVVRKDGIMALYRGYWPHQLAWGPFNAFYWTFFESLKASARPVPLLAQPHPRLSPVVRVASRRIASAEPSASHSTPACRLTAVATPRH
jgi:hypothetical protein